MGQTKASLVLIAPGGLCGGPCAVPVDAVVAAVRTQSRGERERLPRVLRTAQLEQRAAEAEERVVVGRRALDERLELGPRRLELRGAEVRAAEGLADRGLLGIEVARLRERGGGGVEVPGFEQLRAAPEEVVQLSHALRLYAAAPTADAASGAAPTTRAAARAGRHRGRARPAARVAGSASA